MYEENEIGEMMVRRATVEPFNLVIPVFVLIGILAICMGTVMIFNKTLAWKWQQWQNSMRGVPSVRTGNWAAATTFQGYFMIVISIVALGSAVFLYNHQAVEDNRRNPSIQGPGGFNDKYR